MLTRLTTVLLPLCLSCFLAIGCGDDDDATADASSSIDADLTAPDASNAPDGAATPDGSTTPDAASGVDSSGSGGDVTCGEATCSPPNICCVTYNGGVTTECTTAELCEGATVSCDQPEDCDTPTETCCASGIGNPSTSCTADACEYVVCSDIDDCNAGGGETCCDLGVGIKVCSTICF